MPGKSGDYKLRDEGFEALFILCLGLVFHCNHSFHASTVHVFHDEMNLAFIVKYAVIMHLQKSLGTIKHEKGSLTKSGKLFAIMSNSL